MKPLIDPSRDEWRALFLRNQGAFFDVQDMIEWHRKELVNIWIRDNDMKEYDILYEPTDEAAITSRFKEYSPEPMSLRGRTHLALSLPYRGVKDYTNLNELYLYAADMIEKYGITKINTITHGEFTGYDFERYPYIIIWFARPIE